MRILKQMYFYLFPLVIVPFLFLLYTGNIYLFNIVAIVILFVLIINNMLFNRIECFEDGELILSNRTSYKVVHILTIILFSVTYIGLIIRFIAEEVLSGIGSV